MQESLHLHAIITGVSYLFARLCLKLRKTLLMSILNDTSAIHENQVYICIVLLHVYKVHIYFAPPPPTHTHTLLNTLRACKQVLVPYMYKLSLSKSIFCIATVLRLSCHLVVLINLTP